MKNKFELYQDYLLSYILLPEDYKTISTQVLVRKGIKDIVTMRSISDKLKVKDIPLLRRLAILFVVYRETK
jgi:hypothetical protein